MCKASSIAWHADFHAALQSLPFVAEFSAKKCRIARFLLHLYLIQGFSGSFLILYFVKQ